MFVYFSILFLIMLANLVVTVGLYIPVLKRVNSSFSFKSKTYEIHNENNITSQTDTSNARAMEENVSHQKKENGVVQRAETSIELHSSKTVCFAVSENRFQKKLTENITENLTKSHQTLKDSSVGEKLGSKTESAKRRITIMFFVIIVVYVISYTPPLIIAIQVYVLEDLTFISITRAQFAMRSYLTRLVYLNHIVNPFIYGYFDTMFRKQLMTLCK